MRGDLRTERLTPDCWPMARQRHARAQRAGCPGRQTGEAAQADVPASERRDPCRPDRPGITHRRHGSGRAGTQSQAQVGIDNTIVHGPCSNGVTPDHVEGSIGTGSDSCHFTSATKQIGATPTQLALGALGALGDHGGPTPKFCQLRPASQSAGAPTKDAGW